jgi:hypothetical protein
MLRRDNAGRKEEYHGNDDKDGKHCPDVLHYFTGFIVEEKAHFDRNYIAYVD